MPDYIVTGRKGAGKSLAMVGRMKEYIEAGKPVATNINLKLRLLVESKPKAPIWRLPDIPTTADFEALPDVHNTGQEHLNGALVLDECSAFLNARSWNAKDREGIIVWLAHARKRGWDVYFLVQSVAMLDKQVRESFGEYIVVCRRMDRVKVPFVGGFLSRLTLGLWDGHFPKVHIATVRYGNGPGSVHAETWTYRAKHLYAAYDTCQKIGASDVGLHALTWYATEAEIRAWGPPKKPKHPDVVRIMRLPPERRIEWVRKLGLCA